MVDFGTNQQNVCISAVHSPEHADATIRLEIYLKMQMDVRIVVPMFLNELFTNERPNEIYTVGLDDSDSNSDSSDSASPSVENFCCGHLYVLFHSFLIYLIFPLINESQLTQSFSQSDILN